MKPSLIFFTNIPTPYQIDFFEALSDRFSLTVVYYALREKNRDWDINVRTSKYEVIVLDDSIIAKAVQIKIVDFHLSWAIRKKIRNRRFDYAILGGAYWIPNGIYVLNWCRTNVSKVAYFTEPTYKTTSKLKYFIKQRTLKYLSNRVDFFFGVGQAALESFREFDIEIRGYNIPYNINTEKFRNGRDSRITEAIRAQCKLDDDDIVFITSCSLIYRKGVDVLINAFRKRKEVNIKLLIIGDGELKHQLQELAREDSRIHFLGFVQPEHLPSIFVLGDYFLFASRYDGWAVVILEALATDLLVISSTAVGAALDLFTSYKNGILCETDDIDSFVNAIDFCLSNPDKVIEIKRKAVLLKGKIDSNAIADKVFQIFEKSII